MNNPENTISSVHTKSIDMLVETTYVDAFKKVEKARFDQYMQTSTKIIDRMEVPTDHKEALRTFSAFNKFGLATKEIADALNISVHQAKAHLRLVENKLVDQWDDLEKERGKTSRR